MEIYLDNAATSHPKPPEVISAVCEALTDLNGNPGRSGHKWALAGARRMNECRETLAGFIGCGQVGRLSFCFNCTDALNLAIKGVLRRGDHVVSTLLEHNSVLRVLEELRRAGQIEVTLLEPRGHFVEPEQFERALKRNTRLAVVTQASNVTGALQPAAAICRAMKRQGVLSLVDGAQAIGHLPVDVRDLKCDLYAFPGHKGLLGPQGTGGLYAVCPLRPLREGGTGSTSDQMTQPVDVPDRYESGTMNLPGLSGLWAGVRLVQAHQAEYLQNERERTAELLEGLRSLPGTKPTAWVWSASTWATTSPPSWRTFSTGRESRYAAGCTARRACIDCWARFPAARFGPAWADSPPPRTYRPCCARSGRYHSRLTARAGLPRRRRLLSNRQKRPGEASLRGVRMRSGLLFAFLADHVHAVLHRARDNHVRKGIFFAVPGE